MLPLGPQKSLSRHFKMPITNDSQNTPCDPILFQKWKHVVFFSFSNLERTLYICSSVTVISKVRGMLGRGHTSLRAGGGRALPRLTAAPAHPTHFPPNFLPPPWARAGEPRPATSRVATSSSGRRRADTWSRSCTVRSVRCVYYTL